MGVRNDNLGGHQPIVIDKFNFLWKRGDDDNTPMDHFSECDNVKPIGNAKFGTRDGIGISQTVAVPLGDCRRIYNYPTQSGNTLICLVMNSGTGNGEIFHVVDPVTVYGPLLSINGMQDFAFLPYAGRAYISPIGYYSNSAFSPTDFLNIEKGVISEFLYVYAGDGTTARKAAGNPLVGALTIANGAAGHTDPGFHLFGFVAETASGYLTAPGAITGFSTSAGFSVSFGTVPVSGSGFVTKRHLVATKVIPTYNGDTLGYQFFFVPGATINDDGTLFLNNVSFFDADLLEDASHLLDNYAQIPAGAALTLYKNRLCVLATYTDPSIALVSTAGEPEAISQISGIIVVPPDGNPLTNGQELRDVLYLTKRSRTVAFQDNGDDPSTWGPLVPVDQALGTSVHGIATVLDSGSNSVDFLIVATYQGISIFNGKFAIPELSMKIEDYWKDLDRNEFRHIQIINAPIQKEMYIVLPNGKILCGNYSNGLDPKNMRWAPWSYNMIVKTIAVVNTDQIIVGASLT